MQDQLWAPWRSAMTDALYGPRGFYLSAGAPATSFRTAAHAGAPWAAAVHRLATAVDDALGSPEAFTVLDVGAGGGEMLAGLADLAPSRWQLAGVDLAPRPPGLPPRVTWSAAPPESLTGLLFAAELLDVVPVDVVERTQSGLRYVETTAGGSERLGGPVTGRDADWLATWWPLATAGDRAEVGWPREQLWRSLTSRLKSGVAVAVDYAVVPARDLAGTLTSYRHGRQVPARADGSCDITAAVLFESLAGGDDVTMTQREALRRLGVDGRTPEYDGDPAGHLRGLSAVALAGELLDPAGLGGFTWLIHTDGVPHPLPPGETELAR